MKVSEAIEKLAMKRDDALKFQKLYNPSDVGWSANESKAIAFNIAINTLQKIDEPQAEKINATIVEQAEKAIEFDRLTSKIKMLTGLDVDDFLRELELRGLEQAEKVEVPPMIDKFIKDHTDPIFEICAWSDHYGNDGRTCDDPELSVVLDWYGNNTTEFYEAVVNGYTVKSKRWVVKDKDRHGVYINSLTINPAVSRSTIGGKENARIFTDKSKAEAVAILVEGSVEEV